MNDNYLTCNIRNCFKKLKEQAYVTSCSHIFCIEHGQRVVKNGLPNDCCICGKKLQNHYDFVLINLNPTEQYKSMILTGLHPDVVLEIATRSISYYVYQLGYENQIKGNIIKKVKRQNDEIKNYCYKINKKYKYDLLQMENSRKTIEVELENKNKEVELKNHQLMEYSRQLKKLQSKLDSYEREILTFRGMKKEFSDYGMCETAINNQNTPQFNFRNNRYDHNFPNILCSGASQNSRRMNLF